MGRQQDSLTREEQIRVAQGRPTTNGNERDSRQIKQNIDRTRSAMDETLDELGERLNPRNLLDDVIDMFRSPKTQDAAKRAGSGASDFAANLGRQVRDNPIGASLVGAGLTWLAFSNSSSGSRQDFRSDRDEADETLDKFRYDDPGYYTDEDLVLQRAYDSEPQGAEIVVPENYGDEDTLWDSTKDTASSAAASISDAASATGDAISDAASSVVDGVKSAASSVAGAASSVGSTTSESTRRAYLRSRAATRNAYRGTADGARSASNRARSASRTGADQIAAAYEATSQRVHRAHNEAPLALGLGIMALGAIAGALIPRTRREDELMGETSDEAIREAHRQAEQAYQRGEEAVHRTIETAKQSAEAQGLTADSLAERATSVVEKATASLAEAAKEEGLHPNQLKEDAQAEAAKADSDVKKATS